MKPLRLSFVLLWLALAMMGGGGWLLWSAAKSGWRVKSQSETALPHGARLLERQLTGPSDCKVKLVLFDEASCHLVVAANTQREGAKALRDLAVERGAVAGCNGGYFDPPKMLPACLEIAGGVKTGTYGSTSPQSGAVAGARDGKPFIATEDEFQGKTEGVTDLVQCSPILRQDGKTWHFHDKYWNVRTFIATDGQGTWAIGTATHARLEDLAIFMERSEALLGFKVSRAMALDGGPSTALWCSDSDGKVHDTHEKWPVRNVLLVVPREEAKN